MPNRRFYAVDDIEENVAVLVDDAGRAVAVPLDQMPNGIAQGTILRVQLDAGEDPEWSTAEIDDAETDRRRRRSGDILKKLQEGEAEIGG